MKQRYMCKVIAVVLCAVTVLCTIPFAVFSVSAAANTVVTTDSVRLRSSAAITSDNILATLNKSESLTLLSNSSNEWAYVKRSNGTKGYCSVDYLSVPSGSSVKFTGTTTDSVHLRSGASTSHTSLGVLSNGTTFTVSDNSNENWVKAVADGKTGYIYRTYTALKLTLSSSGTTTKPSTPTTQPAAPKETTPAATTPSQSGTSTTVSSLDPSKAPKWYSSSLINSATGRVSSDSLIGLKGDAALSASAVTVSVGGTHNLAVILAEGSLDNTVSFATSDKAIATVSKGGIIKGVKVGKATVSATVNGKKLTCAVTVEKAAVNEDTKPEIVLSKSSVSIEKGNYYMLTSSVSSVTWKTSNSNVATVSGGFVKGIKEGTATITATASGKSATCKVTVTSASTGITIKKSSAVITSGKTLYNSASSATEVKWTSSNTSVAKVSNGFITALKPGFSVISATSSKGTKTCLVKVTEAEPVRFTYAYPNSAAKNEKISLVAITDTTRTAVQFKVNVNGTVSTVNATSKVKDYNTLVWTGTTTINTAGTFDVTAYSKIGTLYSTCDDAKTTVFVRNTKDVSEETTEKRRASDGLITLISEFEGYSGNVYSDDLAGGIPTLGYGKVVYPGDCFYNDMTETEAYAQLTHTINEGGFASNVDSYLQSLKVHYNQHQFDAFVSFAYNIGYYGFKSDTTIKAIMLAAVDKTGSVNADKTAAFVNGTQVNLRSGAGTTYSSLGWVNYPDKIKLLKTTLVNSSWYYVQTADGTKGYIYKDYVTLGDPSEQNKVYLSLVNKSEFTPALLQYHHAGSNCIYGLLYRRVDELDLFYYGDYVRNGKKNVYNYSFTCSTDSSVYI